MRIGTITKYIGISLLLVAAFMLISAGVSAHDGFDDGFVPLMFSGLVTGLLGIFPTIFVKGGMKISRDEGYYIVVGSWLACCIVGMVPYLMYGSPFTFTNALFETISGFTTTGASILNDIEGLPESLLFWRMSTAWIGGIGIVVLFSLVMPNAHGNDTTLTGVEVSDIARETTSMRSVSFVRITVGTYIVLTLLAAVCLKAAGMRWFDAAAHAMSACSTCGFSTMNLSIAAYDSPLIEAILDVFMILASLKFVFLFELFFGGRGRRVVYSEVTWTFFGMIFFSSVALAAGLFIHGDYTSFMTCIREAGFQVASIFTTTGFATVDTNVWPPFCASILVAGSFICGCSGSTSGGIKVDRAVVAAKSLWLRVRRLQTPNLVRNITVDRRSVSDRNVETVTIFIISYLLIVCVGALLNTACGVDLKSAWTGAIACMGNVGPGLGSVGSFGNYSSLPVFAKYVSMVLMLTGRLEIFPLLYVFMHRRHS